MHVNLVLIISGLKEPIATHVLGHNPLLQGSRWVIRTEFALTELQLMYNLSPRDGPCWQGYFYYSTAWLPVRSREVVWLLTNRSVPTSHPLPSQQSPLQSKPLVPSMSKQLVPSRPLVRLRGDHVFNCICPVPVVLVFLESLGLLASFVADNEAVDEELFVVCHGFRSSGSRSLLHEWFLILHWWASLFNLTNQDKIPFIFSRIVLSWSPCHTSWSKALRSVWIWEAVSWVG